MEADMKRFLLMVWVVLAVAGVRPAAALDYDGGKVRFFTGLEYWTAGGAYKNTKDDWQSSVNDANNAGGGSSGSMSSSITGGPGVRAGAFFKTPLKGLELGGSLGYVAGPHSKFTVDTGDSISGFHETDEYTTHFVRAMVQGQQRFPVSEKVDVRVGDGIGFASGHLQDDYHCTGMKDGACFADENVSNNFSGLSYEVGPSVAYTGQMVNVEFGIVYAGFPKMKEFTIEDGNFNVLSLKWHPFGVRLGMEF